VRVADTDLAREDVNRILKRLREDSGVVRIALTSE